VTLPLPRILVCDDDPAVRFAISEALAVLAADVVAVASGEQAVPHLAGTDALLTDLVMPGMDGFALLAAAREHDPELPVVILTARGTERTAVAAIKRGAYDYLAKPFAVDELRLVVQRAIEARALRRAATQLDLEHAVGRAVIGDSPAFRALLEDARRVGRRDVTVLVRGETGTGKELIASLLHAAGPRRAAPCVRFNCAAIPAELAEAELFGHARGAFTGAARAHRGYFQQADGGTIVLDEIGELPPTLQAKLLRTLQDGEVQRVGAEGPERVDVRVVALTHRDLRGEVAAGRFRDDLLYRLAVVELVVPPLRERTADIPALIDAFVRRYAERFGMDDVRLTAELVDALARRPWPGNVRELENAIARILALSDGGELGIAALARLAAPAASEAPPATPGTLREELAAFERGLVERTLAATGGNQSEAARRLGVSRMTLIEKMKRYDLRGPRG
jgi:DNA-binding NtrC family response regulator